MEGGTDGGREEDWLVADGPPEFELSTLSPGSQVPHGNSSVSGEGLELLPRPISVTAREPSIRNATSSPINEEGGRSELWFGR